ncbi:MAG TPA: carboxypeptidase-like regulatory domain-containing protein [Methanocella sp.]|nr:carboxypeptidase-like regulatory domain-containing protein [Methanocella sp.]
MRVNSILLLLAVLLLVAATAPALASEPFTVMGNVTDSASTPLPNACVNLLDADRNTIATTTTDENGFFIFSDVDCDTPGISVVITFEAPAGDATLTKKSGWHETAAGVIVITAYETQFKDYVLPAVSEASASIAAESDNAPVTDTSAWSRWYHNWLHRRHRLTEY